MSERLAEFWSSMARRIGALGVSWRVTSRPMSRVTIGIAMFRSRSSSSPYVKLKVPTV